MSDAQEDELRKAIIDKFRTGVVANTVEPRKVGRIARAVDRGEVTLAVGQRALARLINEPTFTIEQAFQTSVEQIDFEHSTEQLSDRLTVRLTEHRERGYALGDGLRTSLHRLASELDLTLAD